MNGFVNTQPSVIMLTILAVFVGLIALVTLAALKAKKDSTKEDADSTEQK